MLRVSKQSIMNENYPSSQAFEVVQPNPHVKRMQITGLGRPPREYSWNIILPFPTVVFTSTPQPEKSIEYPEGITYTGMVDGHSAHAGTVDHENNTFTLDSGEIYPLPGNGESTPVRSVTQVAKTSHPDGSVRIDMTIIAFRNH